VDKRSHKLLPADESLPTIIIAGSFVLWTDVASALVLPKDFGGLSALVLLELK
jgi:hypothetical protein